MTDRISQAFTVFPITSASLLTPPSSPSHFQQACYYIGPAHDHLYPCLGLECLCLPHVSNSTSPFQVLLEPTLTPGSLQKILISAYFRGLIIWVPLSDVKQGTLLRWSGEGPWLCHLSSLPSAPGTGLGTQQALIPCEWNATWHRVIGLRRLTDSV